jgi:hypothetical protein
MLILLTDMAYDFERQQREKERQERSRQLPTRLPPHQEAVLAMQRGAGNAAVGRMLSAFPHTRCTGGSGANPPARRWSIVRAVARGA